MRVERSFGWKGLAVTVFDGAALITLDGDDAAARAVGEQHLAARLERGADIRTAHGSVYAARRHPGYPPLLGYGDVAADPWRCPAASRAVVARLLPDGAGARRSEPIRLSDLAGRTTYGRWWAVDVHLVPPVETRGLAAATPVIGSRTHLGVPGGSSALCGRVPVHEPLHPASAADCPACLRCGTVRARVDEQLAWHQAVATHLGAWTAGAAARWWPRLAQLCRPPVGPIGDAAVGLLHHGLPGAPDGDTALTLVTDHLAGVATTTRRWAAGQAQRRLRDLLAATLPRHPTHLDDDLRTLIATAEVLLDAAPLAEVLVTALEDLGPALALEPDTVRIATAAGTAASERVQRWLRLQRIAAALGGGAPADRGPGGRGTGGRGTGATTLVLER